MKRLPYISVAAVVVGVALCSLTLGQLPRTLNTGRAESLQTEPESQAGTSNSESQSPVATPTPTPVAIPQASVTSPLSEPGSGVITAPTEGDRASNTDASIQTGPILVSSNLECGWQDESGNFGLNTTSNPQLPSNEQPAQLRLDTYSDGTTNLVYIGAFGMCATEAN